MSRQELFDGMTVGMKLRWAREHQSPPLSQKEVAGLVDLSQKNYQAVERDKSMRTAREIVPQLSAKYKIPPTWFWDKSGSDPYKKSEYSGYDDYVDVVLHVPYISGKVSISMNHTDTAKLTAGLARNNTFGVAITDDDNLPRLRPGMRVFFEPRPHYNDGDLVIFDHPTERIKGPDGRLHARSYIRRYVLEDGAMRLKPQNPSAETFLASGIKILGAAKVLRRVHSDGWYTDEVNLTQIPLHAPSM